MKSVDIDVPDAGFQYIGRAGEHYDFETGSGLFGFVDPGRGDYTLLDSVSCPVSGHMAF